MDQNNKYIPIIGAALVFVIVEVYLFAVPMLNGGAPLNFMDIGTSILASGFVNDLVLPAAALLIFGFLLVNKVTKKRGMKVPWR